MSSTFKIPVRRFPVLEINAVMLLIIYPRNNAPKLSTAAITWLSVSEETNMPMAMQAQPYR